MDGQVIDNPISIGMSHAEGVSAQVHRLVTNTLELVRLKVSVNIKGGQEVESAFWLSPDVAEAIGLALIKKAHEISIEKAHVEKARTEKVEVGSGG